MAPGGRRIKAIEAEIRTAQARLRVLMAELNAASKARLDGIIAAFDAGSEFADIARRFETDKSYVRTVVCRAGRSNRKRVLRDLTPAQQRFYHKLCTQGFTYRAARQAAIALAP